MTATEERAGQSSPPRWLRPPRLRPAERGESERRATWFELFFDLVFVLAVAELARLLHDDPSAVGFARFAALFVPVWWAWVIYTFYADRFDTDDLVFRLLMLVGMLAIVAMAVSLHGAFGQGAASFVLAYLAVRAVPFLLYLRAARHVPLARQLATGYGIGSASAALFWLVSLAVPATPRYICWALAVAIELAIPLVARRTVANTPMDVGHLDERFGLFTIIVLGETVIATGSGFAARGWSASAALIAVAAFGVAAAFWWLYFAASATPPITRSFLVYQVYVFGHLPFVAGITAAGVGARLAIEQAGAPALSAGAAWALGGGVALYLLALTLLWVVVYRVRAWRATGPRLGLAALAALLAALHAALPPPALVGFLVAGLALQVVTDVITLGPTPEPAAEIA